jgi:hypothetical protein
MALELARAGFDADHHAGALPADVALTDQVCLSHKSLAKLAIYGPPVKVPLYSMISLTI